MNKLRIKYKEISSAHNATLLKVAARTVLGSSVVRVFEKDTKKILSKYLLTINMDDLLRIDNQNAYRVWYEKNLIKIAHKIRKTNPKNKKIYPGYKWGHAAKILNLYVREVVEYKRYFSDKEASVIRQWLYVPIDSKVIQQLFALGYRLPFKRIKDINTSIKYYYAQDMLGRAADAVNVPRIWFDDVWAEDDD